MLSLLLFIWNSLPPFNIQSFSFFFLKPISLFISFPIIVRQHAEAGLCFHLCLLAVYRYCTLLFGRRSLASRPLCLQTINNELPTHMQPTECTHAHTLVRTHNTQWDITRTGRASQWLSSLVIDWCIWLAFIYLFCKIIWHGPHSVEIWVQNGACRKHSTQGQEPDQVRFTGLWDSQWPAQQTLYTALTRYKNGYLRLYFCRLYSRETKVANILGCVMAVLFFLCLVQSSLNYNLNL